MVGSRDILTGTWIQIQEKKWFFGHHQWLIGSSKASASMDMWTLWKFVKAVNELIGTNNK